MIQQEMMDRFRIPPDSTFRLQDHDPGWAQTEDLKQAGKDAVRQRALEVMEQDLEQLAAAQRLLWASDIHSVLVVLQAMDAAGKDGMIQHVMSGLNPQGCQVFSFKRPSDEELDHNYLWRYMRCLPERGRIGIFNRSYYEEVLVVKVHPELLARQKLPPGKRGDGFWKKRYEDINNFEHHLVRNGTVIVKLFLNISKDEQKRRFLERLENPEKHWKFSAADLAEREHWDEYMSAFEGAIRATSTKWAPWYVVPANHKWVARAVVADVLAHTIKSLDLAYPQVDAAGQQAITAAKAKLESEG
jgi:PPK2 family polyphosphate:nucleotide phosphotransferase